MCIQLDHLLILSAELATLVRSEPSFQQANQEVNKQQTQQEAIGLEHQKSRRAQHVQSRLQMLQQLTQQRNGAPVEPSTNHVSEELAVKLDDCF